MATWHKQTRQSKRNEIKRRNKKQLQTHKLYSIRNWRQSPENHSRGKHHHLRLSPEHKSEATKDETKPSKSTQFWRRATQPYPTQATELHHEDLPRTTPQPTLTTTGSVERKPSFSDLKFKPPQQRFRVCQTTHTKQHMRNRRKTDWRWPTSTLSEPPRAGHALDECSFVLCGFCRLYEREKVYDLIIILFLLH